MHVTVKTRLGWDHDSIKIVEVAERLQDIGKKPNYTIDTLEFISNKLPEIEFSLIIGEDNYKIFDTWKDYKKILKNYKIFIYPRKGNLKESQHIINENAMYIGGPRIDLSSTNIRNIVSKKAKPKDLISKNVMDYINTNELYQ